MIADEFSKSIDQGQGQACHGQGDLGRDVTSLEGQRQTHPEDQAHIHPEDQTQTHPDGQSQTHPDGQSQTHPDGQSQTHPDGQSQIHPDGQTQTHTDGQTQTHTEGQPRTRSEGQTQTISEDQMHSLLEKDTDNDKQGLRDDAITCADNKKGDPPNNGAVRADRQASGAIPKQTDTNPDYNGTNLKVTDTEVTDSEVTDTKVTNTEVTDPEVTNTKVTNTEVTDTIQDASVSSNGADNHDNTNIIVKTLNESDVSSRVLNDDDDDSDDDERQPLTRSQSLGVRPASTTPRRPHYGTTLSQNDATSQYDGIGYAAAAPPGDESHHYGYMPGMNVEITESESGLPAQRLPEGLRHVMLHVVGSRPSEEVKFRRLKYRLEQEGASLYPENPFMPRATKSQKPQAIIRQQSKRPISRQRSRDPTIDDPSRDQSYASITRAPEDSELPDLAGSDRIEDKPIRTGLRNSSGRQKGILIVLCINDMMASMSLSILAPFFPKEARQKGLSDAMSGWVFGVFALVQCLTSPIFGKVLPSVGAKFLSQAGQFFAGGCTILFGMLQYVSTEDDGLLFIVYCFVLRMFMALGCASQGTAAFAIAARTFPDNPATVFGLLETAVGFGLMLGPAIGGVLYEVGGFVAPFAAIGTAMVLCVPVGVCILPNDIRETVLDSEDNISVREFLKVPAVAITSMAAFIACMAWVMPDPTLEPHLSKFNLSPTIIGLVFLLMSACYAVCSPVWGWVADNVDDSAPMMVVGFSLTGIGFLALGPSPIFQLPPDFAPLWLDIVALIIIGLSISLALVPTYDKILDAAEKAGIQDTLSNCSTVAGLWNASYSFGEFVGPVLAGWMMGTVGFAWTMSVASALCFIMALMMLILYLYERKFGPTGVRVPSSSLTSSASSEHISNERTPLLGPARA